jgi:hypothetical protein
MTALRTFTLIAMCAVVLTNIAPADAASGFAAVHQWHPATAAVHAARPGPDFEWRLALGCGAVAMLILSRLHEPRFPQFYYVSLISACVCCWYGFASGAWPLGLGLIAYTIHILTMRPRKHIRRVYDNLEFPVRPRLQWHEPSRLARLFGSGSN